jgi:hypothetical protein
MHQLNIYHFLDDLESALAQLAHEQDETPTTDLDSTPVTSIQTKAELLTSKFLDQLLGTKQPLSIEEAHTLKILMELTR